MPAKLPYGDTIDIHWFGPAPAAHLREEIKKGIHQQCVRERRRYSERGRGGGREMEVYSGICDA